MNDSIMLAVIAFGAGVWLILGIVDIYNRCKKALRRRELKRREQCSKR